MWFFVPAPPIPNIRNDSGRRGLGLCLGDCVFFLKGRQEKNLQGPGQVCRRFLPPTNRLPDGFVSFRIQVGDVIQGHEPVDGFPCLCLASPALYL